MKIIIFFLILTLNIIANQVISIPNNVSSCMLKKVIKNGWNESNQTLNTYIIQSGNIAIPKIIAQLNIPLSNVDKKDIYDIPKFMLTRDDYIKLFAYSKYLENEGNLTQVYTYYVQSLKGLKDSTDKSLFSLIYKIVINHIILTSLTQNINNNVFNQDIRVLLKGDISPSLITTNELLLAAIEHEKNYQLNHINTIKLQNSPSLIDENLFILYKKYFTISINNEFKNLSDAIRNNNLDQLEKRKQTAREGHFTMSKMLSMWLLKSRIKFYNFLSIQNHETDYITLAKYMIDDEMLVNTPSLNRMYKEYFELVEENKLILEKLYKK